MIPDSRKIFSSIFEPRSIAFIGASNNLYKWGFNILHNIVTAGFKGKIYPINPHGGSWYGMKVYQNLAQIQDNIDLAIIVVKKELVKDTLVKCALKKIPAAIIITAGFSETGNEGSQLEQEVLEIARKNSMRIVGPNTMGIFSAWPSPLQATMASGHKIPGHVAIIAQSGNLGSSISYRLTKRNIGISRLISSGNEADLKTADYLELLENDPKTDIICLYVEGVRDGRRFFELAKRISPRKPMVLLKGGRSEIGARAAMSHTGAMAGNNDVFNAMCRQTGIITVDSMDEMVDVCGMLISQPRPLGNRVGIITMGGGWGVIATDACASNGLVLPRLKESTIRMLDKVLPPYWSRANPVDLVAPSRITVITDAVSILIENEDIDAILALGIGYATLRAMVWRFSTVIPKEDSEIPSKQMYEGEMHLMELLVGQIKKLERPIIPVIDIMAFDRAEYHDLLKYLDSHGIMAYPSPEKAIYALAKVFEYTRTTRVSSARDKGKNTIKTGLQAQEGT